MKVIAFAASNSSKSINLQLVKYASKLLVDADIEFLDLNDYEMPIFSEDREAEMGQPALAQLFHSKMKQADLLLISFAEHNGYYSAAYKNIFDWVSRIDRKVYQDTDAIMLATSPGPGGGARVLEVATSSADIFGANVLGSLAVPNFYENFDSEKNELSNAELKAALAQVVASVTEAVS